MLNQDQPEDFVIATGETHSLKDFVSACFSYFNKDWQNYVVTNAIFQRPTDILFSSANPAKAKRQLGWSATIKMAQVVPLLIEAELRKRKLG